MRSHYFLSGKRFITSITFEILLPAMLVHMVLEPITVESFPATHAANMVPDFEMGISQVCHHHAAEHESLRAVETLHFLAILVLSSHVTRTLVMALKCERTDQAFVFLFNVVMIFLMRFQFGARLEFLSALWAE